MVLTPLMLILLSLALLSQDPFESDEEGWADEGFYVTGCSKGWISLQFVGESGEEVELETEANAEEVLTREDFEGGVTSAASHAGIGNAHVFKTFATFVICCISAIKF